jgi:hypothetical protein
VSNAMQRAKDLSIAPSTAERAAGPSARSKSRKESPVKQRPALTAPSAEDQVLDLPDVAPDRAALAALLAPVASAAPAPVAQQAVLGSVPVPPAAPTEIAGGYTRTRLGRVDLVGNVGHSRNIVYKQVGGRSLVEFSVAVRAGRAADAVTWYKATLWDGTEAQLDLVRQGTYVEVVGDAVQSVSHRTGKTFLDVTVRQLAEGPAKGERLASSPAAPKGYFRRLLDALLGR